LHPPTVSSVSIQWSMPLPRSKLQRHFICTHGDQWRRCSTLASRKEHT
jgi:hypothetical protein